jgi:tetratricopeptide (TPR) repeat protein
MKKLSAGLFCYILFGGLATTVLVGVWPVSPARAAESNPNADATPIVVKEAFQKALQFTRTVVEKQHMVCIVDVESLGGGNKRSFQYDHYPEVERIQMKNGATFARKKDQEWLRSDDWAETGSKVSAKKSDELDSLVQYPLAALDDKIATHDQTQGAVVVRLLKREAVEDTERLYYEEGREKQTGFDYPQFVFSKAKTELDEKALLLGWAGIMRTGAERIHVNMTYSFLFRVNVQESTTGATASPSPRAEEPLSPTAPGAVAAEDLHGQDTQIVADNLNYSREFYSGVHFVAIASLPSSFAYDRYPDDGAERIRSDNGTFARKHPGQPWLKSNDWGQTGAPVEKATAQKLEGWIKLVHAAFDVTTANIKLANKSEAGGGVQWTFTASSQDSKGSSTELVFHKPTYDSNQNVLLHGFTAPLRLQDDKVVPGSSSDRVKFSFGYLVSIEGGDELSERAWEDMLQPKAGASPSAAELKIELTPKDAQGYVNRGDARAQYGDLAGAVADYRRASELDPKSVPTSKLESAYHSSGIGRFERGAYDAAIADFSHAIELKPNDQDLYNDRGVAKWNNGDLEGAIADYNQAIASNPKTAARSYRNRALLKVAKGDKEGAIADYNQAIELEPQNANAYNKRGELKRSKGDLDGAIADFTAAIGLDPKLDIAYKNRGDTKQTKGDNTGANLDLKRARELESGTTATESPTPIPVVTLPAPEKGKVYGFQDLLLHGKDLAGKVVQVEVLPKAGHETDLHDGRYCITLYDPKRVFGFVYCTKEGLQKLGFEDGTASKNQLIYLLMKKDKLTGTIFYAAVGTRFETGNDGSCIYSW